LKRIIEILLTIIFLTSCKNSGEIKTSGNSDFETKTKAEFRKVETKNTLDLKFQILDKENNQIRFSSLKNLPEFPGGFDSLAVFIKMNFEFPQSNTEYIEGKVKSTFVVDTLGKVVDIEIIKRLRKDYDTASYKVISKLPDWKPAELNNNKKVKVKFLLPFKFVMEE
jgi:Gram-negative bacterial TonB protein C-terminal